ncbi:hypothetical protein [Pseudonocardia nigra]|uniref:hypothetical protein n=1 Tax=Pseudonocardia nigra TaxID=1921578 RepID=UPI001C607076|nr:hypothetical protein [Pseudonocardia nigra]
MTAQVTDGVQDGLWGQPVTAAAGVKPTRSEINDPELVADVVRSAISRGYVLIGPAERVFVREAGETKKGSSVEPVPTYEADTVRQLLDAGHLATGGNHIVRHGGREGPATSVLVPKATRAMVTRWANLRPLLTHPPAAKPGQPATAHGKPPGSGLIYVDVVRTGFGLVTCGNGDFSGSIIREGRRYLVETERGQVIGHTASYRAGARMLARHHGFTPDEIEIEHEKDLY